MSIKSDNRVGRSALGGAVSLTVATLTVKLLGVLYKIPLATVLGDEGMGYFNAAYTVYSFFYLLCTAGVPKSVMILISERIAKQEEAGAFRIVKIGISSFLILGMSLALLFVGFSRPIADFIGSSDSRATMICVAPSIIFVAVAGVLRGYLSADMRLGTIAVSQVLEGAVKLILGLGFAILAVRLGYSAPVVSAFTVLGVTVGSLVGLIYLMISAKIKNIDKNAGQKSESLGRVFVLSKIVKVSFPITVSAALMSIVGMIDLALVMRRLEDIGYTVKEATALYGNYTTLAVSMYNLAIALITPISIAFMPMLTRSRALGDFREFRRGLRESLDLTSFVSAPIVIGMTVYSKEILSLLFGADAAEVGAPLLVLLTPAIIFTSYILILNSSLESLSHPMLATLSMFIGAFVKIIVSGLLLGNPDFGISGAPLGTVISYAVSFLVSMLLLSHLLGSNIPLLPSLISYLIAGISVLGSRLAYGWVGGESSSVLSLGVAIVAAALIYIALSLFCGVISGEKITKMAKLTNLS